MTNILNLAERRFQERMIAAEGRASVNPQAALQFVNKLVDECDTATATGLTYGAILAALCTTFHLLCLDAQEDSRIAFSAFLKFDAQARVEKNREQKKLPPMEDA